MGYSESATWGVSDVEIAGGIVQDYRYAEKPKMASVQNEIGEVVRQSVYDVEVSASATVVVKTGTSLPGLGETITIKGKKLIVVSISTIENNQDFIKARLELKATVDATETEEVQ